MIQTYLLINQKKCKVPMRNSSLIILLFIHSTIAVFCQERGEIRIRAGHPLREYFSRAERFRYEQFQEGMIHFENGKNSSTARFNYDLLNAQVLVIQNGDTVSVVSDEIEYFIIGQEKYVNYRRTLWRLFPLRIGFNWA
jgi:hypothetical protein